MAAFRFEIVARDGDSGARAGLLHTCHGTVPTPAFAPVATQGAVKGLWPDQVASLGVHLLMTNAYHLAMRPGGESVAALGGLHALAGWSGPLLTDSGGYQVFSLADRRRLDDDGITFRSHVDGTEHRFTPESVIGLHEALGGDLVMPLDVCTGYPADRATAAAEAAITHRWAERALRAHRRTDQLLFGIVQGGTHADLREACARAIVKQGFQAFAIGGVSVGEPKEDMARAVAASVAHLPDDSPRHLLGVGEPADIVRGISLGIDTFDCVVPTRWARHGAAITGGGRVNLRNSVFRDDPRPIEASCSCPACAGFGRGAIRHFLMAREMLGLQLLTAHNIHALVRLTSTARGAILSGTFGAWQHGWSSSTHETALDPTGPKPYRESGRAAAIDKEIG